MNAIEILRALGIDRAPSDSVKASLLAGIARFGEAVSDSALVDAANAAMPAANPFRPPEEWKSRYKEGFYVTADSDCGVDFDADWERNCSEFWQWELDDKKRAARLQNPQMGYADGIKDATNLNEA